MPLLLSRRIACRRSPSPCPPNLEEGNLEEGNLEEGNLEEGNLEEGNLGVRTS